MATAMANIKTRRRISSHHFLTFAFLLSLILVQSQVSNARHYKVGDLNAWGIPPPDNEQVYDKWSKYNTFDIGDSLLFLYPPSQDSVIQVPSESYNSCNLKDPILAMTDGNSVFNFTSQGVYYFTSGETGHCEKKQKLRIAVGNVTSSSDDYAAGPSASSPSYPTVFGSIPQDTTASASSPSEQSFQVSAAVAVGIAVYATVRARGLF